MATFNQTRQSDLVSLPEFIVFFFTETTFTLMWSKKHREKINEHEKKPRPRVEEEKTSILKHTPIRKVGFGTPPMRAVRYYDSTLYRTYTVIGAQRRSRNSPRGIVGVLSSRSPSRTAWGRYNHDIYLSIYISARYDWSSAPPSPPTTPRIKHGAWEINSIHRLKSHTSDHLPECRSRPH